MCTVVEDALYHHFRCFDLSQPLGWRRHKCPQNEERNSFLQQVPLKHDPSLREGGWRKGPQSTCLVNYTVTRPYDKFPLPRPGWSEPNSLWSKNVCAMWAGIFTATRIFRRCTGKNVSGTRRYWHVWNVKCLTQGTEDFYGTGECKRFPSRDRKTFPVWGNVK